MWEILHTNNFKAHIYEVSLISLWQHVKRCGNIDDDDDDKHLWSVYKHLYNSECIAPWKKNYKSLENLIK